jgi:hypothetical protein
MFSLEFLASSRLITQVGGRVKQILAAISVEFALGSDRGLQQGKISISPAREVLDGSNQLKVALDDDAYDTSLSASSEISSAPSGATTTPTGRPYASFPAGSGTNPEKKIVAGPAGDPSLNGTNTI